jgi:hypothetical protein
MSIRNKYLSAVQANTNIVRAICSNYLSGMCAKCRIFSDKSGGIVEICVL